MTITTNHRKGTMTTTTDHDPYISRHLTNAIDRALDDLIAAIEADRLPAEVYDEMRRDGLTIRDTQFGPRIGFVYLIPRSSGSAILHFTAVTPDGIVISNRDRCFQILPAHGKKTVRPV